jgi:hypothetical protein
MRDKYFGTKKINVVCITCDKKTMSKIIKNINTRGYALQPPDMISPSHSSVYSKKYNCIVINIESKTKESGGDQQLQAKKYWFYKNEWDVESDKIAHITFYGMLNLNFFTCKSNKKSLKKLDEIIRNVFGFCINEDYKSIIDTL